MMPTDLPETPRSWHMAVSGFGWGLFDPIRDIWTSYSGQFQFTGEFARDLNAPRKNDS